MAITRSLHFLCTNAVGKPTDYVLIGQLHYGHATRYIRVGPFGVGARTRPSVSFLDLVDYQVHAALNPVLPDDAAVAEATAMINHLAAFMGAT